MQPKLTHIFSHFSISLVGILLGGLRRKRNVYLFPRLTLAGQEEWRRSAGLTKDIFANDTSTIPLSPYLLLMMNIEKGIWIELELAKVNALAWKVIVKSFALFD